MAYQATKNRKCVETLELVNENGETVKVISVEITAGKLADSLSRKYVDLIRARRKISEMPEKYGNKADDMTVMYSELGQIIFDMMEAVFGKENTKEILNFYENDYIEITTQVMPFITNVILPQARRLAQENKRKILEQYNRKPEKRQN